MKLLSSKITYDGIYYIEVMIGDFKILVDKETLEIHSFIYKDIYVHEKLKSVIDISGYHRLCGERVKFYDGVIICEKCNKVIEW